MHRLPVIVPDQLVSRNLKRHFVWLPGVADPLVFNTLDELLVALIAREFHDLLLQTESTTYHLIPSSLQFFATDDPEPDDPRQPLDATPTTDDRSLK